MGCLKYIYLSIHLFNYICTCLSVYVCLSASMGSSQNNAFLLSNFLLIYVCIYFFYEFEFLSIILYFWILYMFFIFLHFVHLYLYLHQIFYLSHIYFYLSTYIIYSTLSISFNVYRYLQIYLICGPRILNLNSEKIKSSKKYS